VQPQDGTWDQQNLKHFFGPEARRLIVQEVRPPDVNARRRDRLVWELTKSGVYTVKEGYKLLLSTPEHNAEQDRMIWHMIWKTRWIIPHVRMFLWRACQGGILIAQALHHQIPSIDPVCIRYHEEGEYLMHLLFFCPSSRATWFGSEFNLRVEKLRPVEDVHRKVNLLWCVWKARNTELF
jgi:zinc-binding in reverse transcriptase